MKIFKAMTSHVRDKIMETPTMMATMPREKKIPPHPKDGVQHVFGVEGDSVVLVNLGKKQAAHKVADWAKNALHYSQEAVPMETGA